MRSYFYLITRFFVGDSILVYCVKLALRFTKRRSLGGLLVYKGVAHQVFQEVDRLFPTIEAAVLQHQVERGDGVPFDIWTRVNLKSSLYAAVRSKNPPSKTPIKSGGKPRKLPHE